MADNVTANPGSLGATFATDDIGGVHYPRNKIGTGADGSYTDVSDANPLPVDDAGGSITVDDGGVSLTVDGPLTDAELRATAVPVSVSGVATAANQATGNGLLTTIGADTSALAGCVGGTEVQVDVVSSALPSGAATESTLSSLNGKVTAVNTGAVVVSSSALPSGAATESTLSTLNGKVTACNTGAVVISSAIPAGTNLIGAVVARQDVDTLYAGTTALTVKYANIDCASSGNNELVAAVTGKTLKVLSVFLAASGAVDVVFNDGTANLLGGTRKVKLDNTGAAGAVGFVLSSNPTGWFKTGGTNRPINVNLSAGVGVAGVLAYVEE